MAQQFTHEAVVYIWRFGGIRNFTHFGHSAIKLQGPGFELPGERKMTYISFWPGEGAGLLDLRRPQEGTFNRYAALDKRSEINPHARNQLALNEAYPGKGWTPQRGQQYLDKSAGAGERTEPGLWGQKADDKIRLPMYGADGVLFGLDGIEMMMWWKAFSASKTPQYVLGGINCSKVVALALVAGGALKYCRPPSRRWGFWTPNDVLTWSKEIQSKLAAKNAKAAKLKQTLASPPTGSSAAFAGMKLLDPAVWKKASDAGLLAVRRDQVKILDGLLEDYHRTARGSTVKGMKADQTALENMLGHVHVHLGAKLESKRRTAMIALGNQLLHAHEEITKKIAHLRKREAAELWREKNTGVMQQILDMLEGGFTAEDVKIHMGSDVWEKAVELV